MVADQKLVGLGTLRSSRSSPPLVSARRAVGAPIWSPLRARRGWLPETELRRRGWRPPVLRSLLVSIRELEQRRFGVGPPKQFDADGHATRRESCWHGDRRKAGDRGEKAVALHLRLADWDRQPLLVRIDDRIELLLLEHRDHLLLERFLARSDPLQVLGIALGVIERLGGLEPLLERLVELARGDPVIEGVDLRRSRSQIAQPRVDLRLRLPFLHVHRRDELLDIEGRLQLDRLRAKALHARNRAAHETVHLLMLGLAAEETAQHSDARAT